MGKVKKSKRRSDSWIGVLLFLAAGAACGMILGLFIDKTGAIELPFGRYMLLLAGLLFSTAYLVDATYNPFLYFRF